MLDSNSQFADNGKRFLAYLIDILPITIALICVYYFFLGFDDIWFKYINRGDAIQPRIDFLKKRNEIRDISTIIWLVYSAIMEGSKFQGTLGKILMKIKVVDQSGHRLTFINAISRNASKILSAAVFALGFIWILFDKKRQGWHDKMNKTYVVEHETA